MSRITIAIATADRADGLRALLQHVCNQEVPDVVSQDIRVLVVDNDGTGANRCVVEEIRPRCPRDVDLVTEPEPGIPFARNAAVRAAIDDDALIFIDDDERPASGWLAALLRTWRETGADVVMGPVKGVLPPDAPRWARTSGVFDKHAGRTTGEELRLAFTYNTLVSGRVLRTLGPSFDSAFRYIGSSDYHYFRRVAAKGFRTVWCGEALVYEDIPAERARLWWLAKRGYRIGAGIAKSAWMLDSAPGAIRRVARTAVANGVLAFLALCGQRGAPAVGWPHALRRGCMALGAIAGGFGHSIAAYRQPGTRVVDQTVKKNHAR